MTGRHSVWGPDGTGSVDVPVYGGENVMVPVIRGIVRRDGDAATLLIQRRDDPSEPVRGALEIPGGRWRSGESPIDALVREVAEETGVVVTAVDGVRVDRSGDLRVVASILPLVVVAGIEGAFPAVHVVLVADGRGDPAAAAGESTDVQWWSMADIRSEMASNRSAFIPSTYAALETYVAWVDSTGGAIASS
jgi:8-oxo-dGTP pyrophosphatase MutT (NUDIX family)